LLRFGVLCASSPAADFAQSAAIHKLLAAGETEFALLVILGDVPPCSQNSDRQTVDLTTKFAPVPRISCYSTLDAAGYRRLAALDAVSPALRHLDLVLDFTGARLAGEILEIPTHGVWTFSHRVDRKNSLSIVTLVRVCNPPGSGNPLASCILRAEPVSLQTGRRAAMLAAADLPANICKDLLGARADCLSRPAQPGLLAPERSPLLQRASGALGRGIAWARSQLSALLFIETWNVGIVNAPIQRFLEPGFRPAITWVPPVGPHKFIADPFAVDTENGVLLLVEEFDYDRYQGYITSTEWLPGREPEWKLRIDQGVHMSYPFSIRHGGQLYVAPESSLNREVALYYCDLAAGRWPRAATLIEDFAALDSTLIEFDGRWWLFCTCRDDSPDSKLHLFHAPQLTGPWQPHRMNPVKCDIRSSRPGGTLFRHEGSLYRPAQDSSRSYGGALTINRITCLTVDEFREEPAIHLEPFSDGPYPHGWHTLSAAGSITVLDGKRMAFIPRLSVRRFRHKFGRLGRLLFRRGGIG
jgi:hypothetical protein